MAGKDVHTGASRSRWMDARPACGHLPGLQVTVTPLHWFLKRWQNGYYRLCVHRSHLLRLPCFRVQTYDHRCGKHNLPCLCWLDRRCG